MVPAMEAVKSNPKPRTEAMSNRRSAKNPRFERTRHAMLSAARMVPKMPALDQTRPSAPITVNGALCAETLRIMSRTRLLPDSWKGRSCSRRSAAAWRAAGSRMTSPNIAITNVTRGTKANST